MVEQTHFMV